MLIGPFLEFGAFLIRHWESGIPLVRHSWPPQLRVSCADGGGAGAAYGTG